MKGDIPPPNGGGDNRRESAFLSTLAMGLLDQEGSVQMQFDQVRRQNFRGRGACQKANSSEGGQQGQITSIFGVFEVKPTHLPFSGSSQLLLPLLRFSCQCPRTPELPGTFLSQLLIWNLDEHRLLLEKFATCFMRILVLAPQVPGRH